jgi:hypothetical protein
MANGTVRLIRWLLVVCNQLAVLPILGALLLVFSESRLGVYLDWYMKFLVFFGYPAAFANLVNGFVLMLEGRRAAWPWWRRLAALFAISLPVYGVFHYAKCERALLTTP